MQPEAEPPLQPNAEPTPEPVVNDIAAAIEPEAPPRRQRQPHATRAARPTSVARQAESTAPAHLTKPDPVPPGLTALLAQCDELYQQLYAHRLTA